MNGELKVVCDEIGINELFRCGKNKKASSLYFHFETKFEPYQKYCTDSLDGIDLVVKGLAGNYLAPVEAKLTVLPSSGTSAKPQAEWGSEIVVRTAATSYLALGIWDNVKDQRDKIRDIFEETCARIESWTNDFEMSHKTADLVGCLNAFEKEFIASQQPLALQPFWKTKGQSPVLDDDAFDVVVWSDMAFSRLFIDRRATARMSRCLWELSKSGRIRIDSIYRQMTRSITSSCLPGFLINSCLSAGWINRFTCITILKKSMVRLAIAGPCITRINDRQCRPPALSRSLA